ncbi:MULTISPECIES: histidine phosphatase family protein [Arthrobacter]|uniref:Histidine phosphatase family protein n=2 Tax=Arthrobacter TaxID=1663 RepID=A0ABU9KNS7_9MICC|nr:histidine phosphatase family protein [Arthrobacter sp. YJM1]MDP5227534.1 histidine phosphatase family protein [Arthrobacter sp. YJM1]
MPHATVHLMRHGEVHNPDGVLYGRLPGFHLSERGYKMADRLGEYFAAQRDAGALITHLVASPLLRAQETAAPTATALGLQIETDERVIEAENHFEGLKVNPRELARPRHWPYLVNPLRPSWGEAYAQQVERVMAAVQQARQTAVERGGPGAEAVIVSHQLPIWSTRLAAEGRRLAHDPRKRECTLTSLTSLTFDDGGRLTGVTYREPAADLLVGASTTPGA